MANPEHLKILKQGVKVWNEWRNNHDFIYPELSGADLCGADLSGADLSGADLRRTDLCGADLSRALLSYSDLSYSFLSEANFEETKFYETTINECPTLIKAKNLNKVLFGGNLNLDVRTLRACASELSFSFLQGAGYTNEEIEYLKAQYATPIKYYSCFISYSSKDEEFGKRLHSSLRNVNIPVWFAPEDVKGGEKLYEQISDAIHYHDRILIVLSENSLNSDWVETEIRKAKQIEVKENRRKLFPIRLVDYETIKSWECFDTDTGKDLAVEIREYFIPDFTK